MSPRTKGARSEEKEIWDFYFNLDQKKTSNKKIQDELTQFKFRNFKNFEGVYDLKATISLELDFNASKFAKDLMQKYKTIKEIEVRHR